MSSLPGSSLEEFHLTRRRRIVAIREDGETFQRGHLEVDSATALRRGHCLEGSVRTLHRLHLEGRKSTFFANLASLNHNGEGDGLDSPLQRGFVSHSRLQT